MLLGPEVGRSCQPGIAKASSDLSLVIGLVRDSLEKLAGIHAGQTAHEGDVDASWPPKAWPPRRG